MAILVLGGAGYIGSHAARALRRSGYEVVLYDNLSTGFRRLAQGFELVEGDIADEARLRPVLARVDAVMHFAAHAYVGESVENPRKYFRNNVVGGAQPAELRAGRRYPPLRVFLHLCRVRHPRANSDHRADAARAGQSLWRIEAFFRKRARGLQPRLRTALGESALFQRCGSR